VKLHDLHPAPGSRKAARRVGRGHGSGRGKTAGRGTKGQKSRSGGKIPAWFEGGQTPLHVRTPKLHGFKNRFRVEYAPLNLGRLSEVERGTLVTPDVLAHDGLISDTRRPVKILGVGDAPKGVTIHAHAFSKSALDKLSAAGSSVQRLSWPDNAPVDEAAEAAEAEEKRARPKRRTKKATRAGASGETDADAGSDEPEAAARREGAVDEDGDGESEGGSTA
jgi:large subunit ribosomal protein L15